MSVVLLVDLSSIVHQVWHVSSREPNPDYTSEQSVARVHKLAHGHDHVAVCCDSGRSFRRDAVNARLAMAERRRKARGGFRLTDADAWGRAGISAVYQGGEL